LRIALQHPHSNIQKGGPVIDTTSIVIAPSELPQYVTSLLAKQIIESINITVNPHVKAIAITAKNSIVNPVPQ
jgi:hypothetical protein